ncbi:MAG: hypothetical protein K6E54_10375 [Bacteroidaceae bacterium]|nr:hypothetical protein [Bacteroidaceae bacterium]
MKIKTTILSSFVLLAISTISNSSFAQKEGNTFSLTDLSEKEFSKNPASSIWKFEKYSYATGKYSNLTQYTDSCAANYVDVYQPCRVGGERVVQIDGITSWSVNNTFASVTRFGWSDYGVYNVGGTTNNSKERFCYVVRDETLGYEVYSNDEYASVISFIIPEDGFYKVDASVIRQDIPAGRGTLSVVPRIRYATSADIDYAHPGFGMCSLPFGQEGGEIADYDGNAHISTGGSQRYLAQTPDEVTMAFEAKEGDIISFEVNTDSTKITSSWARDFYGRAFYRKLDITIVDEQTAKSNEHFINTYGESEDVKKLESLIDEYDAKMSDMELGEAIGQYDSDLGEHLEKIIGQIYEGLEKDQIHAFNAAIYIEQLEELWSKFIASKVTIDMTLEGNYQLFAQDALSGTTLYDVNVLNDNSDNPWGFYYYQVENGLYSKFDKHDTGSKFGDSSVSAWYKGSGDWLYISDNGSLHPMTNIAPSIIFTAPKDGVYKVDFSCYRPNPNVNVENPLWIRARFLKKSVDTMDKDTYMYAKEFGSVANDGDKGKTPISMEYFVNMKQGDKITWDLDCYTSNRNSSAGTQITNLSVCSCVSEDKYFTLESAKASGIDVFDAYSSGDVTPLVDALEIAASMREEQKNNIGEDGGQYSATLYQSLCDEIEKAYAMVSDGGTQYDINCQVSALNSALQAFKDSRKPYEYVIEGTYSINISGTDKYLTQKNKNANGSNFYATFTNYDGVAADANKNGYEPTDANWTFTFKKITKQVSTGEYNEETGDEIMVSREQTSIYGKDGYLASYGYVESSENETDAPSFRFFKYDKDDDSFAIMTEDGTYWNDSFSWKSPYDKVNTTATPNYIFVVSDMTIEKAQETSDIRIVRGEDLRVVSSVYFTMDGIRIDAPKRGVNIIKQTLSDGSVRSKKIVR